jgi:hypothetical protein
MRLRHGFPGSRCGLPFHVNTFEAPSYHTLVNVEHGLAALFFGTYIDTFTICAYTLSDPYNPSDPSSSIIVSPTLPTLNFCLPPTSSCRLQKAESLPKEHPPQWPELQQSARPMATLPTMTSTRDPSTSKPTIRPPHVAAHVLSRQKPPADLMTIPTGRPGRPKVRKAKPTFHRFMDLPQELRDVVYDELWQQNPNMMISLGNSQWVELNYGPYVRRELGGRTRMAAMKLSD